MGEERDSVERERNPLFFIPNAGYCVTPIFYVILFSMPMYDYICNNEECETDTFEVLTDYEEKPETCPKCKHKSEDRKSFYQYSFYFN